MPRKKISSRNLALFAGPSPAITGHTTSNIKELFGIQSFSYEVTTSKDDISVFGKGASITREAMDPPVVTLNTSYLVSNFDNEKSLGFDVSTSTYSTVSGAFSKILEGSRDERNYFVMIAGEGADAVGSLVATTPCLGFGNGTITSYNFNAAVGSYPTATIAIDAIEVAYYTTSDTQTIPAINTSTGNIATGTFTLPSGAGTLSGRDPILRPWDITVALNGATGLFHDLSTACVQSIDIGVDFSRTNQLCLGSRFRKESLIADVIPITVAVEILAKDMNTGRLSNLSCLTGTYGITASIKRPSCNAGGALATYFDIRGLSYEGQSEDVALGGDAQTVTLNFQGTIGGANDTTKGLFLSGIVNT